jgi:large subunit ribosomal protein L32
LRQPRPAGSEHLPPSLGSGAQWRSCRDARQSGACRDFAGQRQRITGAATFVFLEIFMAVQQNKKSPSKRGMHRSHNALPKPGIAVEPTTGEVHLRHHISPNGFYRGRKVLAGKSDD